MQAGGRAILVAGLRTHVELEDAWDHDHGLRPVPVLEHREFQRFGAVHEQATAKAALILDDPVAAAVPADPELTRETAWLRWSDSNTQQQQGARALDKSLVEKMRHTRSNGEALSEVQIKWPRRPCARGLAGGASVPCAPAAARHAEPRGAAA